MAVQMLLLFALLALCLLVWSCWRIIRQLRARQRLSLTSCLACTLGLTGLTSLVCLAFQVLAGLSHSQAAKSQADLRCLIAFVGLVVLPTAGLLLYRHRQTASPEGAAPELDTAKWQRWRYTISDPLAREATLRTAKKLALVGTICLFIIASIYVIWKVPGPLLSFAAMNGNTTLVKLLLDAGVSVHRIDNRGKTPLMHAAKHGHTDTVRLLLDRGAEVNFARGRIPALFFAIDSGRADLVDLLLQRGADINYQERYGSRPFPYAGQYGSPEVVEALLKRGADLNSRDDIGRTALMRASLCNRLEVVAILLRHGADTALRDRDGKTALSLRWSGTGPPPKDSIVQLLMEYGAPQ